MATRMQQRRGTASQWTSANPVLNAGEIGWESDTNKFKIGDGTNHWDDIDYFADINSTVNPSFGSSITFEGATADSYETVLQITDPTADRTITFPNATGTVVLADGSGNVTVSGDLTVSGTTTTINSTTINATTGIIFEGLTADAYETTLTVTDPTADRTITFPDATGTVQLRVTDVSDTEIGYLNNVTSSIQTQLDAKSTESKTETLTNKSISLGSNTVSGTLAQFNTAVTDADFASLAGTETLTNKTLTSPVINTPTGITKTDVGLANVDNTTDANKPVSTATQTALDLKAPLASPTFTGTLVLPSTVNGPTATTSVNLLFPTTSGHITLGGSQTSGNVTIGGGSARTTGIVGIGTGATTTGTKTIDIGTASTGGTTAITIGSSSGATSNITLNGTVTAANNLVVTGDLTVNGTTTTINSTTLAVDDKNITLGDVATPSDTTADGGGITLKGATDKTFNWVDSTDAWTSSEHINLASGKSYYMNGTALKDVSETLTNKTLTTPIISSISNTGTLTLPTSTDTLVGRATTDTLTNKSISLGSNTITSTLAQLNTAVSDADLASLAGSETLTNKTLSSAVATTALTLNATAELRLADTDSSHYVGFKAPGTVSTNRIWTLPSADGTTGQVLSTNGSGTLSWASASSGGAAFSEFMLIGA